MRDSDERNKKNLLMVLVVTLLIVWVLSAYSTNFGLGFGDSRESWGQFGDYFGGILNPLLSFVALVVLLFNVTLQIRASKEAEERHDSQTFDSRFFQLLTLNTNLVQGIQVGSTMFSETRQGHDALDYVAYRFLGVSLPRVVLGATEEASFNQVLLSFAEWRDLYWSNTSNYFNSALLLVDFVAEQAVTREDARFSLSVLKAQMNPNERLMTFYVMLCSKRHCHRIAFLKDLNFWDEDGGDPLASSRDGLLLASIAWARRE